MYTSQSNYFKVKLIIVKIFPFSRGNYCDIETNIRKRFSKSLYVFLNPSYAGIKEVTCYSDFNLTIPPVTL